MTRDTKFEHEINLAVQVLNLPTGVITTPTDTTYGLIGRLDDPKAIDRIYEIKGRDRTKPLIILASELADLENFVDGDIRLLKVLAERFWPGPLTIVACASNLVPPEILSGGTTVGLRIPAHGETREVIARTRLKAVASTSANLSGAGAPKSIDQVQATLASLVDYIMPDLSLKPSGTESTIIDISKSAPVVLRAGALNPELVLSVCNQAIH